MDGILVYFLLGLPLDRCKIGWKMARLFIYTNWCKLPEPDKTCREYIGRLDITFYVVLARKKITVCMEYKRIATYTNNL